LSITDGVYGILSEMDVKEQISMLGQRIILHETKDIDELRTYPKIVEKRDVT
jgi:hypothetical protein